MATLLPPHPADDQPLVARPAFLSWLLGLILLTIGVSGCVEQFVADTEPPSPRPLVVDGGITSGSGPHTITLSLAAAFEQSLEGSTERIDSASVTIVDHETNTQTRLSQTGPGIYQTQEGALSGTPGHTYHLEVTLPDGRRYRSEPELMPEPVPLDSAFAAFDPSPTGRIKVYAAANDPERSHNYYRWSVRNTREYTINSLTPPFHCWERETGPPFQVSILNDRLINGGRIRKQEVFSLPPGQNASRLNQVDVRQLTLTKDAHEFWSKVREQVEDVGDPFSAPPAPIRGNVLPVQDTVNRALGYFEVAGASQLSTVCFRQAQFEAAPPPIPPTGGCPPAGSPVRGATYDRPSYWVCSINRNS